MAPSSVKEVEFARFPNIKKILRENAEYLNCQVDEENICTECNRYSSPYYPLFIPNGFKTFVESELGINYPRFQCSYLWSFIERWNKAKTDAANCRWQFNIHDIEISTE